MRRLKTLMTPLRSTFTRFLVSLFTYCAVLPPFICHKCCDNLGNVLKINEIGDKSYRQRANLDGVQRCGNLSLRGQRKVYFLLCMMVLLAPLLCMWKESLSFVYVDVYPNLGNVIQLQVR